MGGAFVAGYNGNPYSEQAFDSSQSPAGVFTSTILRYFNPDENKFLKDYYINLEIPGVLTYYDLDDKNTPLEYEVTPVDLRLDFYHEFNDDTYKLFMNQFTTFFHNIENLCYSSQLIKFDEKCDSSFKNKYTHGGYACNSVGTWSNECVAAYCDLGYSFNQKEKKCVKDICSSIPVDEEDDEDGDDEGRKSDNSTSTYNYYLLLLVVLFI